MKAGPRIAAVFVPVTKPKYEQESRERGRGEIGKREQERGEERREEKRRGEEEEERRSVGEVKGR